MTHTTTGFAAYNEFKYDTMLAKQFKKIMIISSNKPKLLVAKHMPGNDDDLTWQFKKTKSTFYEGQMP